MNSQVQGISTNHYISAAVLKNSIQVWGEFQASLKICAKMIACGAKFVIIGLENEVQIWGEANYDGNAPSGQIVTIGNISPLIISGGLAHALVLDVTGFVYSYGCGNKGELGLGSNITYVPALTKVDLSNISNVICHGQISVAISKFNVFVWGYTNPEGLESSVGKLLFRHWMNS